MVLAQAIQVVLFTTGLFVFFLALGVVAVPDDVTVLWSSEQACVVGQPPCAGTWFGIHIPIPQTMVHTSFVRRGAVRLKTSPSARVWIRSIGNGSSSR